MKITDYYKTEKNYTAMSKLTLISRILFMSIRIPSGWASFLPHVFFKSRHVQHRAILCTQFDCHLYFVAVGRTKHNPD